MSMSRASLPATWKSVRSYMQHGDFVTLPQGGGAQLRRSPKGNGHVTPTVTMMFSRRPAVTFYEDDEQLVIHGPIHTTPLKGVLEYVGRVLRTHSSFATSFRLMRYRDNSAVLLHTPSEDPGKPEGDPYRLDNQHSVLIFPREGLVKGTPWRPFGCIGTEQCVCAYCKAVQAKRMDAIARAIAGDLEL